MSNKIGSLKAATEQNKRDEERQAERRKIITEKGKALWKNFRWMIDTDILAYEKEFPQSLDIRPSPPAGDSFKIMTVGSKPTYRLQVEYKGTFLDCTCATSDSYDGTTAFQDNESFHIELDLDDKQAVAFKIKGQLTSEEGVVEYLLGPLLSDGKGCGQYPA